MQGIEIDTTKVKYKPADNIGDLVPPVAVFWYR